MVATHPLKKRLRCGRRGGTLLAVSALFLTVVSILVLTELLELGSEVISLAPFLDASDPNTAPQHARTPPGHLHSYLDCLAARINVDRHTGTERPFPDDDISVPYMVLPVTIEEKLMMSLMCNLTVHIRHIVYVQNGAVPSMTAFLGAVTAALNFTQRVRVMHKPGNFGYAAALNMAARDFLKLPFDEAPFFLMANNDVLLPGGMMEKALPLFYNASRAGRGMLDELEAEVAAEPNEHTPQHFRDVPLRSTDGRHVLVTSRLLPDRIRYQPLQQRRTAFAGFYGELYPDTTDQTAFWAVTRLALEVAGFFDENCYPAYFEDTDLIRRFWLLGFQGLQVPGWEQTPLLHIGGGSRLHVGELFAPQFIKEAKAFLKGSFAIINRAYWSRYALMKYGPIEPNDFTLMVEPNEDDGTPLDAFVINQRRRCAIEQLEQRLIDRFVADPLAPGSITHSIIRDAEAARGNPIHSRVNGAAYYRNGSTLRLLTDCAAMGSHAVPGPASGA
ncbi:hypothetical protein GH5_08568 [Leishmania sp. Ghana 2012 LV757]|uniref:uncharacterized protein n=1 Tax=Leishmania sp. Ghana 2012 LV757 TaxID=2803181 RepID=UPI001B63985D|nr:hypothetical protein GH5_08567 [Leishmania sp. Ghana 2012 LV757]KAG5488313.1 hypothetical protein GH5_08568 [Leishmania sp. Ghana 2012 LV757]